MRLPAGLRLPPWTRRPPAWAARPVIRWALVAAAGALFFLAHSAGLLPPPPALLSAGGAPPLLHGGARIASAVGPPALAGARWTDLSRTLAPPGRGEQFEAFDLFAGVCIDVPDSPEPKNPVAAWFVGDVPNRRRAERALARALGGPREPLPVLRGADPRAAGRAATRYPGRTYLPNCLWSTVPGAGHLMFGASMAMELGERPPKGMHALDRVSMVWCPLWRRWEGKIYWDFARNGWEFGRTVLDLVFARWPAAGLIPDLRAERFPIMRGVSCFDELLVSRREGVLLARADSRPFLERLAAAVPGHNTTLLPDPGKAARRLDERCRSRRLRAGIFQRHQFHRHVKLKERRFVNLDDIIGLLADFTSSPVDVFDVNHTVPLGSQIDRFDAYDVLLTPVGSQMSGMVLVGPRAQRAVVEIGACVRDTFWKENGDRLGYRAYVLSTGHVPDVPQLADAMVGCRWAAVGDNPGPALFCPARCEVTDGDLMVNTTLLRAHLEWTFGRMCDEGWRPPRAAPDFSRVGCAANRGMCGC